MNASVLGRMAAEHIRDEEHITAGALARRLKRRDVLYVVMVTEEESMELPYPANSLGLNLKDVDGIEQDDDGKWYWA